MSQQIEHSMSLAHAAPPFTDTWQKIAVAVGGTGLLILFVAGFGALPGKQSLFLGLALLLMTVGTAGYAWRAYLTTSAGIKNNGAFFSSLTNRGLSGWMAGIVLTGFYVLLYFYPNYLGLGRDGAMNTGLIALFDPLSQMLKGQPASEWFVYGTLYTLAILIFGVKFILKYRHNRYQVVRTFSVMFFQLGFAFLLPEILLRLNYPYNDFKNMWPLNYYFFHDWNINQMLDSGAVGMFMLVFGVVLIFIISPALTYFYGKRWYCSWVCGCGGLAETAGDPFRHLSDKSLKAWRIERWLVHGVLVFVVIMTIGVLYSYFSAEGGNLLLSRTFLVWFVTGLLAAGGAWVLFDKKRFHNIDPRAKWLSLGIGVLIIVLMLSSHYGGGSSEQVFFLNTGNLRSWYGFLIGAIFSGVIGVGFYPLLGNRVWCRFGCPMAAILGLQQRFFSRFRITTNGGQCISCGNCSTYCEMGIDVRWYAQRGQNIVRASCVGCGICAAVCPRGVLRLENGSIDINDRTSELRTLQVTEKG